MSDVTSLIKRGTPSAWPHELTVITDPSDPLCDPDRLNRPILDERLINFALMGQIQPVVMKIRGKELVLGAGRGRWKMATVINHLAGTHAYRGALSSVKEAIERHHKSDLGKRIVEICPKGMKLTFTIHRGTEKEAVRAMVSENEQRDDDATEIKIRRAQRLARLGFTAEDQAADMGVSVATVKRWIKADLDKPKGKKAREASTGPTKATLRKIIADGSPDFSARDVILLRFAIEGVGASGFAEEFPRIAKALGAVS